MAGIRILTEDGAGGVQLEDGSGVLLTEGQGAQTMGAKQILVSADDATYYLLPGGTGEITRDGKAIKDTIFGQTYESELTGPINWTIKADAVYKGYPGYVATLKKPGVSTAMVTEACTHLAGQNYQITNAAKQIMDRATAPVVFDGGVDHTADVTAIDFLFGIVTFRVGYVVGGAVTITGHYFPMQNLAKFQSFTLTQTATAINNSDMPTLQGNGGFETHTPGLKIVTLDMPCVFSPTDGWDAILIARSEYVVEINPDGTGVAGSVGRGFFRLMTDSSAGAVGALEIETLKFSLNVPLANTGPAIAAPFEWQHGANSPIPKAIQTALTQMLSDSLLYGKYLYNGVDGYKGPGVVVDMTLKAGMDSPNVFTVHIQGSGAIVLVGAAL